MMRLSFSRRRQSRGFSLMVVLLMTAVALLILAGVMDWVSSTGTQTARREEYYSSLAAAEAATEKVIAAMTVDFQATSERSDMQGADFTPLDANLGVYQGKFASTELSSVANFEFTGPTIGVDATYVSGLAARAWTTNLSWKYSGFNGYAASYRVVSNARNTNSENDIIPALRQDVQFASIPIFEYALFFGAGMDMELNPAHENFTINGPVHGNANVYCEPHTFSVTYSDTVTASGFVTNAASPLDPQVRIPGTVVFQKERDLGVAPLNLPIGLNNTPANLHKIIELPVGGDPPLLAQNQYYNKADLVVLLTNNLIRCIAGGITYNHDITNFFDVTNVFRVDTSSNFYDYRESTTIRYVEIDVGQIPTSSLIASMVGYIPTNIFIADLRPPSLGIRPGIRLVNASDLSGFPASGLTIASREPLYLKGNFNSVAPKPASLIADAIYVLSAGWNDANSGGTIATRVASADVTVNAGILAGIVPSDGFFYSGGVENVLRLLEDWTGRQFTFSGSIVVLFASQVATAPWTSPPTVYLPPNRSFSHDVNFRDSATLPPGTPYVRTVIRQERAIIQANSTL